MSYQEWLRDRTIEARQPVIIYKVLLPADFSER